MTHRKDLRLPKSAQGKTTGKIKAANRPPGGSPFIWLTLEILESPAWRALGGASRMVLDRILIEHMCHAGTENGNLICPYDDIVEYGVRRPSIAPAIRELTYMGLIRVEKGQAYRGEHVPSRYRLTWLPKSNGEPATNEWKAISTSHVAAYRQKKRGDNRRKKANRESENRAKLENLPENVVRLVGNGGATDV